MKLVGLVPVLVLLGIDSAAATCACECSPGVPSLAVPYIAELRGDGACTAPPDGVEALCTNFVCAKCGQILECYVHSGSAALDAEVCSFIDGNNHADFCSEGPTKKNEVGAAFTACHQQCDGDQGVRCYPRLSNITWIAGPAMIGTSKCQAGAGNVKNNDTQAAALSNFGGYRYCSAGAPTCEARESCLNGPPVGGDPAAPWQSYACTATARECAVAPADGATCLVEKCDGAGGCKCPPK